MRSIFMYACTDIFIDKWFSIFQTFRLLHEEGFFVGASTGLNVAGAVKVIVYELSVFFQL